MTLRDCQMTHSKDLDIIWKHESYFSWKIMYSGIIRNQQLGIMVLLSEHLTSTSGSQPA